MAEFFPAKSSYGTRGHPRHMRPGIVMEEDYILAINKCWGLCASVSVSHVSTAACTGRQLWFCPFVTVHSAPLVDWSTRYRSCFLRRDRSCLVV